MLEESEFKKSTPVEPFVAETSTPFVTKEKAKLAAEEYRKKRLQEQKESMKKIQAKSTVKAPKNVLHRCLPSKFYISK